ncbi:MAG: hypothetical protein Q7T55_25295, partial [Solirubrobacteraceae bacterium]|nr:hypothetical protein [Solirubrobacteraceae bacterium]
AGSRLAVFEFQSASTLKREKVWPELLSEAESHAFRMTSKTTNDLDHGSMKAEVKILAHPPLFQLGRATLSSVSCYFIWKKPDRSLPN